MTHLDPNDPNVWQLVRATMRRSLSSSRHCAVASIGPKGQPHVTPIGSVMLTDPGSGIYLDVLNVELGRNLDRDPRLTVMAVDSAPRRWLTALLRARFNSPPGVRLVGTAGPRRPLTEQEVDRFRRRVRPLLRTKGGQQLWGRDGHYHARDLSFTEVLPVHIPRMSTHLWEPTATSAGAEPVLTNRVDPDLL